MADLSLFSLEEDDGADIFITQTPSGNKCESVSGAKEDNLFELSGVTQFGVQADDLRLPCAMLTGKGPVYSDISDDDFEVPSSQKPSIDKQV